MRFKKKNQTKNQQHCISNSNWTRLTIIKKKKKKEILVSNDFHVETER